MELSSCKVEQQLMHSVILSGSKVELQLMHLEHTEGPLYALL